MTVDSTATYRASESPYIIGYKSEELMDGFRIDFIADGGKVIKNEEGVSAYLSVPTDVKYLRAKITFSRIRGNGSEQFFAWTQPIFVANAKTE